MYVQEIPNVLVSSQCVKMASQKLYNSSEARIIIIIVDGVDDKVLVWFIEQFSSLLEKSGRK